MSKLEDKAAEAIDKSMSVMEQFATKIGELVNQHGDAAWELARGAARVDAANELLWPTVGIMLTGIALHFLLRGWRWAMREESIDVWAVMTVGAVTAAVIGGISLLSFANAWAWAGLFYPELWMVKKVLGW